MLPGAASGLLPEPSAVAADAGRDCADGCGSEGGGASPLDAVAADCSQSAVAVSSCEPASRSSLIASKTQGGSCVRICFGGDRFFPRRASVAAASVLQASARASASVGEAGESTGRCGTCGCATCSGRRCATAQSRRRARERPTSFKSDVTQVGGRRHAHCVSFRTGKRKRQLAALCRFGEYWGRSDVVSVGVLGDSGDAAGAWAPFFSRIGISLGSPASRESHRAPFLPSSAGGRER